MYDGQRIRIRSFHTLYDFFGSVGQLQLRSYFVTRSKRTPDFRHDMQMDSKKETSDLVSKIVVKCKNIAEACDTIVKSLQENAGDLNKICEQLAVHLDDKHVEVYKEIELNTNDAAFIDSLNKEDEKHDKPIVPGTPKNVPTDNTQPTEIFTEVDGGAKTSSDSEKPKSVPKPKQVNKSRPDDKAKLDGSMVVRMNDDAKPSGIAEHVDIRKSITELQEKLDRLKKGHKEA